MSPTGAIFKTGEPNMLSVFRALLLAVVLLSPVFDSMSLAKEPALSPTQPTPAEMAKRAGVKLPSLPWHLADFWWVFDKPIEDFKRLEIEITIDRDIPDSYNLYISPVGLARINGLDFYGGLQTNVNGWATKTSRTRVHPGMGAIFSRWSRDKKKPIGLDHVRKLKDGLCESAGYEGQFCSVRRPFRWGRSTHVFTIAKGKTEKNQTWFDCRVRKKGETKGVDVGGLRFEGSKFSYWARHSAFVEVYSTSKIPRSGIPKVNVTFGYPRFNGRRPKLKRAYAIHPDSGVAASPACARVLGRGQDVRVEVGAIFKRKPERRVYDVLLAQ